jgi:hypothetical protein
MKVGDDCVFESICEVENVERDPQAIGNSPGIVGRTDTATARVVVLRPATPQLEHDSGDVVAGLHQ